MKKLFVLAGPVVLAVGFVGCAKENSAPAMKDIKVELSVADKDGFAETRAVKNAWADGDKIMIFFNVGGTWLAGENTTDNTLTLTYNDGSWSATKNNWSETLSNSTSGSFIAIHYRGDIALGENLSNVGYYFATFAGGEYLSTSGDYTITGGVMTLPTLTMKMPDTMVQFSVQDLASNNKEWELLVNFDTEITTVYDPTASDATCVVTAMNVNTLALRTDVGGFIGNVSEEWMSDVVNGADRSFVGMLDEENDEVTTKYVFVLKNVTDYEYYKFEYAPSPFAKFEGRTAYLLPPLTLAADGVTPAEGCKWTLLQ